MTGTTAEVVICGAGIAGIAAAYHIAVRRGLGPVVLVDERPPLSLTSDKSTEAYRNWWPGPGPAMVSVMNRSIDLLEELARESGNVFRMNRRGYLFAAADAERIPRFMRAAEEAAALGSGPVRVHRDAGSDYQPWAAEGFESPLTGADIITEPALIRRHFPYLTTDTVAVLHARRCGWFSGQQLGQYLLERCREKGVRLIEGRVERILTAGGRVSAVEVAAPGGSQRLGTPRVVIAAGPFIKPMAALLGVELPVFCERHGKIAFVDPAGAMPRHAPMTIWADPLRLDWPPEERALLEASPEHRRLLGELQAGAHGRPEGGGESQWVLGIWTYEVEPVEPTFPPQFDPWYPEIVLRGMARMIPALAPYLGRLPHCVVDGGYYTKTPENRFLSGPLPVEGAYLLGALSGYGLMAANGAADLLADYIAERPLPPYAPAFRLDRYQDPAYVKLLETWPDTGQL
ncbi:MAG TPA: FAD-dependent oxidoreductase [Methylomirabilota bacterium]|nr:FAD-dependent oxidoreductase [Methylomirabilota bacterium]